MYGYPSRDRKQGCIAFIFTLEKSKPNGDWFPYLFLSHQAMQAKENQIKRILSGFAIANLFNWSVSVVYYALQIWI